jgi:hypothetical protein
MSAQPDSKAFLNDAVRDAAGEPVNNLLSCAISLVEQLKAAGG